MNAALTLDSLTPTPTFDDMPDMVHVVDGGQRERRDPAGVPLRPYSEVAALMFITGVVRDIPSVQQIIDIERRALLKLRNHPKTRALLRDLR
jgi:hypothetical protein